MLSLYLPSICSVKTKGVSFSVMCSCVISKLEQKFGFIK